MFVATYKCIINCSVLPFISASLFSLVALFMQEFEGFRLEDDCDCVAASGHSLCPGSKRH